jgi:rhodanese-related sulfurtransferase
MDLSQAQWKKQLSNDDNAIILDVRTEIEVSEGYIPKMKHLDIYNAGAFMEEAKQMDPSMNYYVYCRSGGRSGQACAILKSIGFANTFNLLGGFSEWEGERTL